MRITLRQIFEKSETISIVNNHLDSNLRKMSRWKPDYVKLLFGKKDPNWCKCCGRNYERGVMVIRSTVKLINAALTKLLPNSSREEILKLSSEIVTMENIINKFENVYVEAKTNPT